MKPTGIVRDPVYLKHDMGAYHPENPRRLQAIYQMIDEVGSTLNLKDIAPRIATREEIAANHDPGYVDDIASTAGKGPTALDPDTSTCADSWDAAIRAVGGVLNLVDAVIKGEIGNGFALVRPPGHHAEKRRAMGFCLFNNVALAARHAINEHGMERVAIVDWDLHHGNGTQNSFYDDPRVLFVSTHQYPHYPGTGGVTEVGSGPGKGFTVNVPMPAGAADADYLSVFHTVVCPVLESFNPELILVSAGFDAHESDPLGSISVTEDGYGQMIRILMHQADELCSGRLILTLEGGYDLGALQYSVRRILSDLSLYDPKNETKPEAPSPENLTPQVSARMADILAVHQEYWPDIRAD